MHAAGILGLATAKEPSSRAASLFLQVGDLESMQVTVLSIGNPRLAAKVKAP